MIVISNLSKKQSGQNYTFSDLHLDLTEKKYSLNKQNTKISTSNDIISDLDASAIKNSVVNLLFQKRYLNPTVNMALKQYIGQPISDGMSTAIGDKINHSLFLLEPRITVNKILVGANIDKNAYNIAIIYTINSLSKMVDTVNGILNNSNGIFLLNNLNN